MDKTSSSTPRIEFPWNRFIAALLKMTPEQRMAASPEKAAAKYGLPIEQTTYWIEHYRRVWDGYEKTKKNPRQQRGRARR